MTKELKLSGKVSGVVLLDDEDYEALRHYAWHYSTGYAVRFARGVKPRSVIRMHRLLVEVTDGQDVDHINGNKLDNRRCNLRACTRSQNISWAYERKRANANKPQQSLSLK